MFVVKSSGIKWCVKFTFVWVHFFLKFIQIWSLSGSLRWTVKTALSKIAQYICVLIFLVFNKFLCRLQCHIIILQINIYSEFNQFPFDRIFRRNTNTKKFLMIRWIVSCYCPLKKFFQKLRIIFFKKWNIMTPSMLVSILFGIFSLYKLYWQPVPIAILYHNNRLYP